MENQLMDHLFRHHYGKMVSVLTRIFGLAHLETIEDAIQDTFIKALSAWRTQKPEHPEAWLTQAAKNRVLDIFRKLKSEKQRGHSFSSGMEAHAISELFLDSEIQDSQLRMIFTACHPALSPSERIAFSLKTISGFSTKEIASALLTKEETVKKRLSRARKTIKTKELSFAIPTGKALPDRMSSVLEVLYLIFNEGFHSNRVDILIRKELCSEAMRLCQLLLMLPDIRIPDSYALFSLMCFHAARLDSRVDANGVMVDLEHQDRSKWLFPLIRLGNDTMEKAVESGIFSHYHYEAAIAAEHIKARTFKETDWNKILLWRKRLHDLQPTAIGSLNMVIVYLQLGNLVRANELLQRIDPGQLEQRAYLYYGTMAEFYKLNKEPEKAISSLDLALATVKNVNEKEYLLNKKEQLTTKNS